MISALDKLTQYRDISNFPLDGTSTYSKTLSSTDLFENRTITGKNGKELHYTYNDYFRRSNFSLAFGGGLERQISIVSIFLQYQYIHAFTNFNKLSDFARKELADFNSDTATSGVMYFGEPTAFFRSIQFFAGITLFFKKRNKSQPINSDSGEAIFHKDSSSVQKETESEHTSRISNLRRLFGWYFSRISQ